MTPEEQDVLVIGNTLEETAYHEAGHIVVAAVLGLGMRPKGITIWEAANDVMDGLAGYWDDETDWEKNLQAVRAGQIANGENFRSLTPREQSQTTITSSRLSENTSQEVSPAIYIVKSPALRDSLFRLATDVADHGFGAHGQFQAAKDLLLRRRPRALKDSIATLIGDDGRLTEAAKMLLQALPQEPSVLPIQGPPGSGKTFTGARMIVELANNGRRVGITAVSHKVISNLLREVCKAAAEAGVAVRAVQKANEDDGFEHPMVMQAKTNEAALAALTSGAAQVAAGTAWLWAREEMANSVDVLIVDEGGQMSLANVLAISQAATSVVLLGDPQQLDQPQRGVHPPGADVSALGHLLNGRATIGAVSGSMQDAKTNLAFSSGPGVTGSEAASRDSTSARRTNQCSDNSTLRGLAA